MLSRGHVVLPDRSSDAPLRDEDRPTDELETAGACEEEEGEGGG